MFWRKRQEDPVHHGIGIGVYFTDAGAGSEIGFGLQVAGSSFFAGGANQAAKGFFHFFGTAMVKNPEPDGQHDERKNQKQQIRNQKYLA